MSVDFIGMIASRGKSEIRPPTGPLIDPVHLVRAAQPHSATATGFDRVLVAHHSHDPDAILVASQAAVATRRIGFMVAHRPAFLQPTWAARQFATLDVLRARESLEQIRVARGEAFGRTNPKPQSVGSQRLLAPARGGKVRDKRLRTGVAAAVGAGANTTDRDRA